MHLQQELHPRIIALADRIPCCASSLFPRDVLAWGPEDVQLWLRSKGLFMFSSLASTQRLDGPGLLGLQLPFSVGGRPFLSPEAQCGSNLPGATLAPL